MTQFTHIIRSQCVKHNMILHFYNILCYLHIIIINKSQVPVSGRHSIKAPIYPQEVSKHYIQRKLVHGSCFVVFITAYKVHVDFTHISWDPFIGTEKIVKCYLI